MGRPLRRASIEEALQVSKPLLRRWVEGLEPLCSRETQARKATYYSRADLSFLFVVKMLTDAGLDIEQIKPISPKLYTLVAKPVGIKAHQVATLHFSNRWHLDGTPPPESLTLHIPIWAAAAAADGYWSDDTSVQRVMNLGVASVGQKPRGVERG